MAVDVVHLLNEIGVLKKEVKRFSDAVPGLKADLDGLKLAVSVAAVSAQILKIDYSLWKVDEKGVTFRGTQKVTWSRIAEADKEKARRKQVELEERLHSLFLEKSHESDIKAAQGSAEKANRDIRELRTSLRTMGQSSIPGTGNKKQEFNQIRNSIRNLTQALAGI